ncbi:MAG: tRNA pseudouridine(38-40) synthase TruA [Phycisphaerales bacterium]|nr:tRNA pseudouridine(38-40) synthase TruA [Phycisphaerales bacterium]
MMRNLMLVLAYDGSQFHGWQNQPKMRTVQDCLEKALRRTVRHRAAILGCSRTDSGVHAAGYVANLYTTSPVPNERIARSVGSRLPKDMTLIHLTEVPLTFHATLSAKTKLYRYRLYNSKGRPCEQLLQQQTYHCWQPLCLNRMREAAKHWLGRHDFSSFASAGNDRQSNVRRIIRIEFLRSGHEIRIDIEGDGFLYKQVRNMVGTLCEIGRGQWAPEYAKTILEARDRTKAGPTAPARGLCLQWVRYDIPNLPPPRPDLLKKAREARPPAGAQKADVDGTSMSTAPMPPGVEPGEEPCA